MSHSLMLAACSGPRDVTFEKFTENKCWSVRMMGEFSSRPNFRGGVGWGTEVGPTVGTG